MQCLESAMAEHGATDWGRFWTQPGCAYAWKLAPTWADSQALAGLKNLPSSIGIEYRPLVMARAAALLMVDGSRSGNLVHMERGKSGKIDETVLQ